MTIELRPIRVLSPDAIAPLLAASAAEGLRFVARLSEEWAGGAARYDAPGEVLLGGYEGGRLVGVGGLTPDPYGGGPRVGRLRRVYVLPGWRRRGVGRWLVLTPAGAAAGWYGALVLRTDMAAAARFYEALGYAPLPAGGTATHRRRLPTPGTGPPNETNRCG
jgi:GNAT superfamily N-acetyltransferase